MESKTYNITNLLNEYLLSHRERLGIKSMGLFGSFARGENRQDSDVDIFVEMEMANPFILVEIKEELEKLFNRKVDIVRLRKSMNPYIKARIEKEGVYV